MEGRRVSSRNKKYNPLFILFLCLVAAVAVLLIVSIVLGVRLGGANKKLKASEEKVKELTESVAQLEQELSEANKKPEPALPSSSPTDAEQPPATPDVVEPGAWLDLTGHSEVEVKPDPDKLLEGFETRYTTAGVNMRSGPGKTYKRITTVDYGTQVEVAAEQDGWSFVKVEDKFGWISSSYLSASEPGGSGRGEATSGSIRP